MAHASLHQALPLHMAGKARLPKSLGTSKAFDATAARKITRGAGIAFIVLTAVSALGALASFLLTSGLLVAAIGLLKVVW